MVHEVLLEPGVTTMEAWGEAAEQAKPPGVCCWHLHQMEVVGLSCEGMQAVLEAALQGLHRGGLEDPVGRKSG